MVDEHKKNFKKMVMFKRKKSPEAKKELGARTSDPQGPLLSLPDIMHLDDITCPSET
jgi:hypothetical protein